MTGDRAPRIARGAVADRAAAFGLGLIGAFATDPGDGAPIDARALFLLGYDGSALWRAFAVSPEAADGRPHPLDRWTKRVGDALAAAFHDEIGASALYPFDVVDGAAQWPFLRWAQRAEAAWSSPIGMLISAKRGLWSSYRLALATRAPLLETAAPTAGGAARPCDACDGRPCRTACPVDAFAAGGYDVDRCAAHLRREAGRDCLELGCRARRACPVGVTYAHAPDQATFHMRAFLAARDVTS